MCASKVAKKSVKIASSQEEDNAAMPKSNKLGAAKANTKFGEMTSS